MKSKKQIVSNRFFKDMKKQLDEMNKELIHFANNNQAKYLDDFIKIKKSITNVSDLLAKLKNAMFSNEVEEVKKDYCNVCGKGTYNIMIVMGQYTCPSCAKEIN